MDVFSLIIRAVGIISFILTTLGYIIAIISYFADRSSDQESQATATTVTPRSPRNRRLGMTALIIATIALATLAIDGTIFVLRPLPAISVAATSTTSPYAYDFESGIDGWGVSETTQRPIVIDTSTAQSFSGKHALRVTGQLIGDASPDLAALTGDRTAYQHLEPVVYFDRRQPTGFAANEPYDLSGRKQVSCYLYLPRAITTPEHQTFVRLFVKDTHYDNSYSTYINIDDSNVDHWFPISLVVGANADLAFDSTKVHGLGIRIETPAGSTVAYNGPLYIDACTIEK